jgi:hypothetical protein
VIEQHPAADQSPADHVADGAGRHCYLGRAAAAIYAPKPAANAYLQQLKDGMGMAQFHRNVRGTATELFASGAWCLSAP